MDELIANTKRAVEKCNSKQAGDRVKASKAVLVALTACRKYIEENETEDRGIAQRFARDLSEILSVLPMFRNFATDKKSIHNIQNKQQADEHLESIQKALEESIKNLEQTRKRKIHEWVKAHPVLGKLRRSASKKLPQGAYVLLFRSSHAANRQKKGKKPNEQRSSLALSGMTTSAVASELAVTDGGIATQIQDRTCQTATLAPQYSYEEVQLRATCIESESSQTECLPPDMMAIPGGNPDLQDKCVTNENAQPEAAQPHPEADSKSTETACCMHNNVETETAHSTTSGASPMTSDTEEHQHAPSTASTAAQEGTPQQNQEEASPRDPAADPVLVVRPAPEGKIFTRFRPREFSDDLRMYRMFRSGPPLVGACIIAEGKLVSAIGDLPQPDKGGDQLRHLVSLSKEAVGKPGREFVESNSVLNELFHLFKSKAVHKDAYVLLFQYSDEYEQSLHEEQHDAHEEDDDDDFSSLEHDADSQITEAQTDGAESTDEAHSENGDTAEHLESNPGNEAHSLDESGEQEETAAHESEQHEAEHDHPQDLDDQTASHQADSVQANEAHAQKPARTAPTEEGDPNNYELVSKRTEDGRIITRFRNFDFNDSRSLYEGFKKRRPVVGAAIIKERELLKVIGSVPSIGAKRQLDLLLRISNRALEKPAIEFIEQHEILNELYKLANGDMRDRECSAILFADEDGRLAVMTFTDRRGKQISKLPLFDLKTPRLLFDRFKTERPVVGASVISYPAQPAAPTREYATRTGGKDNRDRGQKNDNFRSRQPVNKPPSVVAAFGRTPLKQNVLLSAEILKRLGVDPSIII